MRRRLGFAHRGASAGRPGNTLSAFGLALDLGAPGLETDVWMTADAVPVLHHGGAVRVRRGRRRRPISTLSVAELPGWLPRLADLFAACGTDFELSVDLKDPTCAPAVVGVAGQAGHDPSRLWLCGSAAGTVLGRPADPAVRLVASPPADPVGSPAWADRLNGLRARRVDAVNLRRARWSRERVDSVHAVGLLAFGWDAQSAGRIGGLLALGCDGVYSDHVDRLVAALRAADGDGATPPAG